MTQDADCSLLITKDLLVILSSCCTDKIQSINHQRLTQAYCGGLTVRGLNHPRPYCSHKSHAVPFVASLTWVMWGQRTNKLYRLSSCYDCSCLKRNSIGLSFVWETCQRMLLWNSDRGQGVFFYNNYTMTAHHKGFYFDYSTLVACHSFLSLLKSKLVMKL